MQRKDLGTLDTKLIMYDKAKTSEISAKHSGIDQYHSFVAERIDSNNATTTKKWSSIVS